MRACFAPAPQKGQPVDLRQSEIENHGIILFRLSEKVRALTVRRAVDRIAGLGKRGFELTRKQDFIFNNQNAQTFLLTPLLE